MSNPTLRPQRNSSIEVLRIAAMVLIVLSHVCRHSGFDLSDMPLSLNRFAVQWGALGNLGVDIYLMITGYFLCTKTSTLRSLPKLFVQVWFYSIVFFLVCKFGFHRTYSLRELVQVVLPTLFEEYWFFTAYVVLMVLCPGINLLLDHATQKQMKTALMCLLVIWVIIPTLTTRKLYGNELAQFILFYIIGAYFRKYPDNILRRRGVRGTLIACSIALLLLSTVVLEVLGLKISALANKGSLFFSRSSVLIVGAAVGLFSCAVYCKPFTNRFINAVAGCTFGVYLIHDNLGMRDVLWKQVLQLKGLSHSVWLIPAMLGAALAVFAGATIIELLRQKTVAKPMTKALEWCIDWISIRARRFIAKLTPQRIDNQP